MFALFDTLGHANNQSEAVCDILGFLRECTKELAEAVNTREIVLVNLATVKLVEEVQYSNRSLSKPVSVISYRN